MRPGLVLAPRRAKKPSSLCGAPHKSTSWGTSPTTPVPPISSSKSSAAATNGNPSSSKLCGICSGIFLPSHYRGAQRHHHGHPRRGHGRRDVRADGCAVAWGSGAALADAGPLSGGARVGAGPSRSRTGPEDARGVCPRSRGLPHGLRARGDRSAERGPSRDRPLRTRPGAAPEPRGATIVSIDSGVGLANATLQQRLVVVRLFYDHLIEEGRRDTNPVGRGRYTPGHGFGGHRERGWSRASPRCPGFPRTPSGSRFSRWHAGSRCAPA